MAKSTKKAIRTTGVVAYCRVSTEEQAVSGLGLRAQENAIRGECDRRGLQLIALHQDAGLSAKNLKRPALESALLELETGQGSILMVAKLDRLTRSVHDATGLMAKAANSGWDLIALDAPVDTTTPQGAAMAQVLAVFAELERRLVGERTKSALAVRKSQGIRLGRPSHLPTELIQRILQMRSTGMTLRQIADLLNREQTPTGQGGKLWYAGTVRYILQSQ